MAAQQQHVVRAERAGVRGAFFRRSHQQIGVAEFIPAIPERHFGSERPPEVEEGNELHPGRAEGQHCRRVVVTHGIDVGPRFVDLAVDDHLAVETHVGGHDRLGIQRHLQDIGRLDQLRGAVPRDEIAVRILGIADADVSERVDNAFIGENAVGDGQFVAQFGESVGHGWVLSVRCGSEVASGRTSQ